VSTKNPLVSVIMPYSNRPEYLDIVLTAYEKQSYNNIELVVVYDGLCSVDDLNKVTKGRDVKCFAFSAEEVHSRRGLSRNIGAANAQGDILIFNDVDVIPDHVAVERIVKVHSATSGLVLCAKGMRIVGGLDAVKSIDVSHSDALERIATPFEYDPSLQWSTMESIRKSEFWWSFISRLCSFPRRDFLFLAGFDPEYFGWGYEDTDLGYRILRHGLSIAFFNDIIQFHIDHARDSSNFEVLRNLDRFTRKFPELKHAPVLVKRRRELREEAEQAKYPDERASWAQGRLKRLFVDRGGGSLSSGTIAVVIPVRNGARYLKEAVVSAIHQTRHAQEIYVVVDPSQDATETIAQEIARTYSIVRCIKNITTRGVSESRNQGIVASASEYVMFLDSDDVLKPSYLEKVAHLLDRNPKVGMAYSDYAEFGDRNRVVTLPEFNMRLFLVDCIVMGPAMARRRALEWAGTYDSVQVFEDWELWMRFIEQGWSVRGVHEALYNYRVHKGNRTIEQEKMRKQGEDLIYQNHMNLYKKYGVTRTLDGKWLGAPPPVPYR